MPTNRESRELEIIKLSLENIIRSLSAIQTNEDSAVTQEINKSKAHLVQGLVHILLGKKALENPHDYEVYMQEMKDFTESWFISNLKKRKSEKKETKKIGNHGYSSVWH